jgi:hypothetical protein
MSRTLWLMGGLGNVLFQMFAHRVIERDYGVVNLCNGLLERNWLTKLGAWSIHESTYKKLTKKSFIKRTLIVPLVAYFFKKIGLKCNQVVFLEGFELPKSFSKTGDIFGYFQSKGSIEHERVEFEVFCKELSSFVLKEIDFVGVVHYRMGDSEWARSNGYYYDFVKNQIKKSSQEFLIVTDSLEDARNLFAQCENVTYLQNSDVFNDFIHLANAKLLYCAPSTFSWWAAHLSVKVERVFIPKVMIDKIGFYNKTAELSII